jgi:hypothetical protein
MRHAGPQTLEELAALLTKIRRRQELTERKPGTFYKKSKAFIHFHEDPAGIFADLKRGDEWERLRVSTRSEQKVFLDHLASALKEGEKN